MAIESGISHAAQIRYVDETYDQSNAIVGRLSERDSQRG